MGRASSRGLSEAIARWSPAALVLADIDAAGVEATAAALGGDRVHARRVDVASEASMRGLFERTADEFERLDVVINNAGIAAGGEFHIAKYFRDHFETKAPEAVRG